MKRLFNDDTDKAFMPFYDFAVTITTKEGKRQTLKVSLFDDIEGEPLSQELSMETERKDIQIVARRRDWSFLQTIRRGDTVEVPPMKKKYSISSVENDFAMGIIIKAR